MKRQIDPNLTPNNDIDSLLDRALSGNDVEDEFDINETKTEEDHSVLEIVPKKFEKRTGEHSSNSEHHHSSSEHHHHHHSSSSSHHSSGHHSSSHHSSGHHHHSSGHSKKKKKKKLPLIVRSLIIILAIIVAGTGILGATYFFSRISGGNDMISVVKADTQHEEIITYKGHQYEFNKDVVSIAFIGVDQRDVSGDSDDFVGCADADIIAAIDTKTGTAKLISMPRDTMVDVDQYRGSAFIKTDRVQLCLAYAYGDGKETSCTNVTKAMSRILYNVPIDKYIALDLDGIKPLNDAVGGVTVDALYDLPEFGIKKGETVTLKGDMAEAYVRTRDMDRIDASLDRKIRQEQYIKAFVKQLLPAVRNDFSVISALYNTASKYSQSNISINNVTYLASLMLSKNITDFETYSYTGTLSESEDSIYPDVVHAELTADEDSVMETVLAVYYTQIS